MKLTLSSAVLVVFSLGIVVLSACLVLSDQTSPSPAPVEESPKTRPIRSVPEVPSAVERALRKRIRQLEADLAAAQRVPAVEKAKVQTMPQQTDFRPSSPREMMENFKKSDPRRYEAFKKRFAEKRKMQLERTKGRLSYLESLDTSAMTEEELSNHEKLQELLVERENLPEFSESMSDEEMRAGMQRRQALDRAIRRANEIERSTLLNQMAISLGLEKEEAAGLTEVIQEIIHATDSDRDGRPHRPPPPPKN